MSPEIVLQYMHIPVCISYGLGIFELRNVDPGHEGYNCSHGKDS